MADVRPEVDEQGCGCGPAGTRCQRAWPGRCRSTGWLAERLSSYPAEVRRDFATVVQVALRECPRRWRRAKGVQDLWVVLRDAESDGGTEVAVRRPAPRSLEGYWYADHIHNARAFRADVNREMGDNRCLALLYGSAWLAPRLPLMSSGDRAVWVEARHRSGDRLSVDLPFVRRPFRRIGFDPAVRRLVDGIAGR